MKSISFILLFTVFSFSCLTAQQQYDGILVSKFDGEHKGKITVNLNGPNDEMIEIVTSEKTSSKAKGQKTKQTITSSAKMNVAIIHHIIINDTTYYFRDIKYDYNEKIYRNTAVRLIDGTLDCGMFQTGRSQALNTISIKLPNKELSELVAADFDYYKTTLGWHIFAFGKCESMHSKMLENKTGYTWNDKTSLEDRISIWKSWIQEYNACNKKE